MSSPSNRSGGSRGVLTRHCRAWLVCVTALFLSPLLLAHHSGAMFDRTKKVTLTGVVVKFFYGNPHSWIDIKVKRDDGKEILWAFEAGAPWQMKVAGLTPEVLKIGDKVTLTGHPLRDGRPAATYISIVLPDGTKRTTQPLPGTAGDQPELPQGGTAASGAAAVSTSTDAPPSGPSP
jgi:hypothetical protein